MDRTDSANAYTARSRVSAGILLSVNGGDAFR